MRNQNIDKKIDWEMLVNLPLDSELARKAAPRITEHNALNQIASALHESIHIFYAVKHGSPILYAGIGTNTKFKNSSGNVVKGSIIDLLDKGSVGSIESYLAAGIFELKLDCDKENYVAKSEEENAVESIKIFRERSKDKLSLSFCSDLTLISNFLEKIYPHELSRNWPIIKTLAKALLFYRDKNGNMPGYFMGSLSAYVRSNIPNMIEDSRNANDFFYTLEKLSPAVKKQNLIEKKQYEKWMRENDLDTILKNWKQKRSLLND